MENKEFKILAIDDNPDNLISLNALIKEAFPKAVIFTAISGEKGLKLAVDKDPDVILLDIVMPKMDGFEVCRKLKADQRLSDIPVVFVTALKGDKESRIKALECGGEAFLAKPIDESELTAQVRAMVKIKTANTDKRNENERLKRLVEERTSDLVQSQAQLKGIFENLQDAYFQADLSGHFTVVSPSSVKMYGYQSPDELIGQPADKLYFDINERTSMLPVLRSSGSIKDYVCQGRKKDGSAFWASMNVQLLKSSDGQVIGTEGVVRDISGRRQVEEALKQSEERFQLLFNQAPLGYQSLDFDGCFLEVNQQWLDTLGFSREEVIGKWFGDFLSPEYKEGFRERFPLFKAQGQIHSEFEMVHKNGSKIFIAFEGKVGYNIDGGFKQTHCILQDITRKKRADEALKNSLSLTEATLESIHNGILVVDPTGQVIKTSKRFAEMWQIPDDVLASGDDNILMNSILDQVADPDMFIAKVMELYAKPDAESTDLIYFQDGRVFERVSKPMYLEGKPKGRVWSFLDITDRKQAEDAFKESQTLYHSFIEQLPSPVFRKDKEGRFILANSQFFKFKGLTEKDMIGHTPMEVAAREIAVYGEQKYATKYASVGEDVHEQIMQTGKIFESEEEYINHSDGAMLYMQVVRMPVIDSYGTIIGTQGIIFDITQRKLAEKAQQEIYEFNNTLLKTIPFGMDIVDEQGNILFQSENMESTFSKKAIGCKCWELYRDDKSQCPDCPLKKGIEIGETANYESKGVLGDRIFSINHTGMIFKGKKAMLEIFQDITERKKSEQELQESVQLFQGLFNASPDAIVLIDPHHETTTWPIVDCNEAACLLNGYTREEMIGQSIDLLNGNIGTPDERISYYNMLKRDGIIHREIAHLHKDGHIFPIETSSSIISIGEHEMVLGIDRDITDRKQAEMTLKESEDRYRQFISQVSEGVYRFECDEPIDISLPLEEQIDFIYDHMFIAECNDAFLKMYGIKDQNDMIGKSHLDFLGGRSHPVNREILRNFVKNGYHIENAITEETGFEGQYLVISNNWLGICENNYLVRMWGTQFDITEKIRAEKVQHVLYAISNATLLASDLTELIEIISNELGKLLDSNNFFIAFYDESTKMLSTLYEKGDRDNINNWPAAKSLTGFIIKTQKSMLATETDINKLCETGEIEIVGIPSKIWLGVPLSVSKKVIGAIVVQSYDNPEAFNEKDKLMLEFVSHQISISIERKKSEQELNSALIKAQESDRLKSSFLANMSHEIRTPLNSIIGFSELMTDRDLDADQQSEFAKIILNSGNSLLSIISDIMDFSKIEAGQIVVNKFPFVTQRLISEIQKEYSIVAHSKGIELKIDPNNPKEDIWLVSDENRLRQVLINLAGNAIKFTKEGYVELGIKDMGDSVQFRVTDTGIGIPEEYHDKIFERFRQVESADSRKYGGNGLGLAISKSLVEILGGEIWIESVQRIGSTFYFTIPKGLIAT